MKNCRQPEEWMQAELDGCLPPGARERLSAHLAVCGDCRTAWDDLRRQNRLANAWARRIASVDDPGDAFTDQVLARIADRAVLPIHASFPWAGVSLAGLALALLTLVSFVAGPYVLKALSPPSLGLIGNLIAELCAGLSPNLDHLTSYAGIVWDVLIAALIVNGLFAWRTRCVTRESL